MRSSNPALNLKKSKN